MPGTDPIRIAVITFALPRDNLLIAEATKLALAPLFPNRGIKLIFCTFEEFDRIVLSRGAEFILGTSGAVTRLSTFGFVRSPRWFPREARIPTAMKGQR